MSNPTLTNVTFSGHSAVDDGGGIANYGSNPIIRKAILWGNTATGGPQIRNNNSAPSINDSIVEGGCPLGSTCTHILTADLLLGALGNYGGGTATFPLLPGSPAIDAGNDATCASTDQRGVTRPQGAHCDIGAYESRLFMLTKTGGDGQSARINTPFTTPLMVSVSSTHGEPVDGGVASQCLTANGILGSYEVTANTNGVVTPAVFTLSNIPETYSIFLPLVSRQP